MDRQTVSTAIQPRCIVLYMNSDGLITETRPIEYYDGIPSFWDDADRIGDWLREHPGYHNPSTIQRRAKVSGDVYQVLNYLVRHVEIQVRGNGAWRNYAAR
jgi:hypothetical protein